MTKLRAVYLLTDNFTDCERSGSTEDGIGWSAWYH